MATFQYTGLEKQDDYMTPKYAWENIQQFIPKDKVIWEAFYGDGKSGEYLKEMGYNVIHEPVDFFKSDFGDIVVSNPPFSKSKEVIQRLKVLDKPFIIIMPVSKVCTAYFRETFKDDVEMQLIIPKSRIHFNKQINGETPKGWKNACNFDCFYYCWKMGLPSSLNWI